MKHAHLLPYAGLLTTLLMCLGALISLFKKRVDGWIGSTRRALVWSACLGCQIGATMGGSVIPGGWGLAVTGVTGMAMMLIVDVLTTKEG